MSQWRAKVCAVRGDTPARSKLVMKVCRLCRRRHNRHGFITYLVTANVPPKVAQTLARHSTISLTMDRYTHLGIDDLVAGLKRLPVMAGGNEMRARL